VTPKLLEGLAALRRQRERQAMEALTVQAGALRRAEQSRADAARAVRDHLNEMQAKERALIGTVAGRVVLPEAIRQIQAELDGAGIEAARRREAEVQAASDLQRHRNIHAETLANFQSRQRAVTKLDHLREEETARQRRWQAALGDADAEDLAAAAGPRP
jgi:hypothetical protein